LTQYYKRYIIFFIFLTALASATSTNIVNGLTPTTPTAAISSPVGSVQVVTSAGNNQVFFGQDAVQVIISDPNARSGGGTTQGTIPVSIIAEDTEHKKVAADTFDIPETVLGTGKFEFYLTHHDSILANGAGIHPVNTFGVAGIAAKNQTFQLTSPGVGKTAPVIRFGSGGELDTGTKLYQNVFFKIMYGDQLALLFYEKTPSTIMLDRNTYGSDNTIHVFIADQSANLNPTVPDRFNVNVDGLKSLLGLSGGTFNVKDNIVFTETGPNAAIFEAAITLGDDINATSKSLSLTLHDKVDYRDITSIANNNLTDFSRVGFNVEDTDGKLNVPELLTLSNGVNLSLSDFDQNKDSEVIDTIPSRVTIAIEGGDSETVNMEETGANSGIFVIANSGNSLKTTFTSSAAPKNNNGILEFTSRDLHNDIVITYSDPHNHYGQPQLFVSRLKLHTSPGTITLPSYTGIKGQFVLGITDPDLNDNPESIDSYDFTPIGDKPAPLVIGGTKLADFAQIGIQIIGDNITTNRTNFNGNRTFTLVETGINTGTYEAQISTNDVASMVGHPLKVDDKIKVSYFDNMEEPHHVTSAVMNITKQ
jgi:hypothetical protein